jgi:hypothetical protein
MDEESRKTHQELWEQYMEVERRELEQRRSGQLGRALGLALPGESQEELQRITSAWPKEDWWSSVAVTRSGTNI